MAVSKMLALLAVVLFVVALIIVVSGGTDRDTVEELTLGGLAAFAAAHAF